MLDEAITVIISICFQESRLPDRPPTAASYILYRILKY